MLFHPMSPRGALVGVALALAALLGVAASNVVESSDASFQRDLSSAEFAVVTFC